MVTDEFPKNIEELFFVCCISNITLFDILGLRFHVFRGKFTFDFNKKNNAKKYYPINKFYFLCVSRHSITSCTIYENACMCHDDIAAQNVWCKLCDNSHERKNAVLIDRNVILFPFYT